MYCIYVYCKNYSVISYSKVIIWISNLDYGQVFKTFFLSFFLAPTRSPRRGDLVRACVCPCVRASVRDILQNDSENEF